MNLWLILIPLVIFILVWILFFSHIFVHLILKDKIRRASFIWLGCGFYLDWSAQKTGFYLFNQQVFTSSMKKKQAPVKKAGKRGKVNYIILWKKKDAIIKTLKIVLSSFVVMLRKTKVERFSLSLRVATPDPALTGIVYGGLSSLSYSLQPFLSLREVDIYPDFKTETPRANLEISFKTKLSHALLIGFRTFLLLPKLSLLKTMRKLYTKER
jgi:hypothetical protein